MERVAHQTIILQFILQLGTQLKTDPRNCYAAFFKRFETMQPDYLESFTDELDSFKRRVKGKSCSSNYIFIYRVALARRQRRNLSVFESSCHLPSCSPCPWVIESLHCTVLVLNVKLGGWDTNFSRRWFDPTGNRT